MDKDDLIKCFMFDEFVDFVRLAFPEVLESSRDAFKEKYSSHVELHDVSDEEVLRALDFFNPRLFDVISEAFRLHLTFKISKEFGNPCKIY